jgi:hypothetical protein
MYLPMLHLLSIIKHFLLPRSREVILMFLSQLLLPRHLLHVLVVHLPHIQVTVPFAATVVHLVPTEPNISTLVLSTNPNDQSNDLECLDQRLDHCLDYLSTKSLLAAHEAQVWNDVSLTQEQDTFCIGCKNSTIRTAAHGSTAVTTSTKPGQVLFCNWVLNSFHEGITSFTYFPNYLLIVNAFSEYCVLLGLTRTHSVDAITSLRTFEVHHRPHSYYTFKQDLAKFHVDAGSQLISIEFSNFIESINAQLIAAAPHHREQNGICERRL